MDGMGGQMDTRADVGYVEQEMDGRQGGLLDGCRVNRCMLEDSLSILVGACSEQVFSRSWVYCRGQKQVPTLRALTFPGEDAT